MFCEKNMLKILLITNETYGDDEDKFLLHLLKDDFLIEMYDISQAIPINCSDFDVFLFRNAWPGRIYYNKIQELIQIASKNHILVYNSLKQRAKKFAAKEYLYYLCEHYPSVIPTYKNLHDFPDNTPILIKPKNGGSSYGVQIFPNKLLLPINLHPDDYIIQPYLKLKKEISFYFIDRKFIYALRTRQEGMENRWNLEEFSPTDDMLKLAQYFVDWNNMPYGIDRIDFALTFEEQLLLMEIESDRSYLSLEELSKNTLTFFLKELKKSILTVYQLNHLS